MTTTATIPNSPLDEVLSVQRYLNQLRSWQTTWLHIDHRLQEQLHQLDGTKPLQLQQAAHLSNLRRRMAMTLVKEPLTIPEQTLKDYGVPRIRQHLAQQFVSLTKEERLLWLNAFIFLFTHDLRQLDHKIATVRDFRSLGQTRNFLLGGESGMGKTTYLDWLIFNHLPVAEEERNHVLIIGIQAPVSNQTARPLLWRLLLECGQTYLKNDNEEVLLMKLVLYFQQCGVELIVIDEIQHIIRPELRRRILEISNMTQGIPMICASCRPIQWTAGDEEVQGRWNDFFHLQQYTGARLDALLTTVELLLPFSQDSHLALRRVDGELGIADLIEQWTGGILRDIMILIRDACRRAIEQSSPCLDRPLLEATWKAIQTKQVTNFLDLIRTRSR
jgi:hypothetical protein